MLQRKWQGPKRTCAEHGSQPHLIAGLAFLVDILEEPCVVGTEVLGKHRAAVGGEKGPQRVRGWEKGEGSL